MILYHGSKENVEKLEKRQASSPYTEVPEDEKQKAIYWTPDYEYSIAMAARPKGVTLINNEEKTIEFEKPEGFNPETDIYIYAVDSEDIPKEFLKEVRDNNGEIDKLQFSVLLDEIKPKSKEKMKAREVMKYFKLLNWKENKEKITDGRVQIR